MANNSASYRWGRILAFGILSEAATIVLIIVTVTVQATLNPGESEAARQAFGLRAGSVLGPIAGSLFCLAAAFLATRPLTSAFRIHGLLVAAVAAALTIPGLLTAPPALRLVYVGAIAFKLLAGFAGGVLSERRARENDHI